MDLTFNRELDLINKCHFFLTYQNGISNGGLVPEEHVINVLLKTLLIIKNIFLKKAEKLILNNDTLYFEEMENIIDEI